MARSGSRRGGGSKIRQLSGPGITSPSSGGKRGSTGLTGSGSGRRMAGATPPPGTVSPNAYIGTGGNPASLKNTPTRGGGKNMGKVGNNAKSMRATVVVK